MELKEPIKLYNEQEEYEGCFDWLDLTDNDYPVVPDADNMLEHLEETFMDCNFDIDGGDVILTDIGEDTTLEEIEDEVHDYVSDNLEIEH